MKPVVGIVVAVGSMVIANAPDLIGFLLPWVVQWLNRDVKNEQERYIVTMMVCIAAAILLHFEEVMEGGFDNVAVKFLIILGEAQLCFKLYFKTSWVRKQMIIAQHANDIQIPERVIAAKPEIINY